MTLPRPAQTPAAVKPKPQKLIFANKGRGRASSGLHMVTFYRSLTAMLDAGLPLFAIFEFMAREGEEPELCEACGRIAQRLVGGETLHHAAHQEPQFFGPKAVRMMEAGYKGGTLAAILRRLAEDEERAWKLKAQLKSQLMYPLWISGFALLAVLLLPPLVLTDLLETVVQMTGEPPQLTRILLNFSAVLGSPWTLLGLELLAVVGIFLWRHPPFRRRLDEEEPRLWSVPALGTLWRDVVTVRFLRVFSMSYEAGMPATQCLQLGASASGSLRAHQAGQVMKRSLLEGATLAESLASGEFLPAITLEAIEAGEQVGEIPVMMNSAAKMIEAEVESRIEAVAKIAEPLILAVLGAFVGIFALGCLLPIIKLTETL